MGVDVYVNRLRLPDAAVVAMQSGRWQVPADALLLRSVFGDEAFFPCFYGAEQIEHENATWPQQATDGFLGRPDGDDPPGDIDPHRSVLIGDLGPDYPFALDYRTATTPALEPRVIYLRGDVEPQWVTVAPSFAALLTALHL